MKDIYQMQQEELFKHICANDKGLTAKEVAVRQEKYGENVLEEGKRKTALQVFLEQFCDLLVREYHCHFCGNYFKCNPWVVSVS